MKPETVILVDLHDSVIGEMEKLQAHQKGLLHRAFSIFVFNSRGELLLQKRANGKYHSGGLWTNTCCSHPRKGESITDAAFRRLKEEMGFTCNLQEAFTFIYRAELNNDLIEHEYDHVLFGTFDGKPDVDPKEVADWKWMSIEDIKQSIKEDPRQFTEWFLFIFDKVADYVRGGFARGK